MPDCLHRHAVYLPYNEPLRSRMQGCLGGHARVPFAHQVLLPRVRLQFVTRRQLMDQAASPSFGRPVHIACEARPGPCANALFLNRPKPRSRSHGSERQAMKCMFVTALACSHQLKPDQKERYVKAETLPSEPSVIGLSPAHRCDNRAVRCRRSSLETNPYRTDQL